MAGQQVSCASALTKFGLLNRADFKKDKEDFMFGAGTSAFQAEGGIKDCGRGASIWDTFLKEKHPVLVEEYEGACDHYHKFEEDVEIIKEMGLDSYRFSISWPRILPDGRWKNKLDGKGDQTKINQEGVLFYIKLIKKLKDKGIKPFVTLFHWDLPQALQDEYKGFLGGDQFVKDFCDYAELCFTLFGNEVEYWTTFNEPHMFVVRGYYQGIWAPGYKTSDTDNEYKVMHNLLQAHAEVVELYSQKYKKRGNGNPDGKIGIVVHMMYPFPRDDDSECDKAVQRLLDFQLGWMLDPVLKGEYPKTMRDEVKNLPEFSDDDSKKLKKGVDFVGLNYYGSVFVKPEVISVGQVSSRAPHPDACVRITYDRVRDGKNEYIGNKAAGGDWQYIKPEGFKKLLVYMRDHYNNPTVFITENGYADKKCASLFEYAWDIERISYHYEHLCQVKEAIKEEVNVKGYFIWSLLDCLEWCDGSTVNFGVIHVTKEKKDRIPKLSALWFKDLLTAPTTK